MDIYDIIDQSSSALYHMDHYLHCKIHLYYILKNSL
ncbi:hypothetical protein Pint_31325 [Pistacia integerrima]|uniref:Uncharacterized protein n=1 Tax=Pistacia integerrima TaxID=434235 RepID=A0ACC0XQ58_9ROSI|nr:hypothetical protein Pint_31325 [Pistacia integerrima]